MNMNKKLKLKTAWMCLEAYNGNCDEVCDHLHLHKKNHQCNAFCFVKHIQTECIEIEYGVKEE